MNIKIRAYKEKDKEQVIELIIAVLQEIFKKKLKNKSNLMNDLKNIKMNYKAFYVAEQEGIIAGTIAIKKETDNIAKKILCYKKPQEKRHWAKAYEQGY